MTGPSKLPSKQIDQFYFTLTPEVLARIAIPGFQGMVSSLAVAVRTLESRKAVKHLTAEIANFEGQLETLQSMHDEELEELKASHETERQKIEAALQAELEELKTQRDELKAQADQLQAMLDKSNEEVNRLRDSDESDECDESAYFTSIQHGGDGREPERNDPREHAALKHVADTISSTTDDVAKALKISSQLARYLLENLEEDRFVSERRNTANRIPRMGWHLEKKGRKYLAERDEL